MFNKGVYTAIITPFDDKNNVDYDTLCNLIKRQIENCISGIILLGTTGESPTLDIDEKKQIVRNVIGLSRRTFVQYSHSHSRFLF